VERKKRETGKRSKASSLGEKEKKEGTRKRGQPPRQRSKATKGRMERKRKKSSEEKPGTKKKKEDGSLIEQDLAKLEKGGGRDYTKKEREDVLFAKEGGDEKKHPVEGRRIHAAS